MAMGVPERGAAIEARRTALRREENLWLLAYPFAWIALFAVSSDYWFLPAGLRLGTLLLLPRRAWWKMALAEWAGILCLSLLRDAHPSALALLLSTTIPWCIYAGVERLFARPLAAEPTPQSMARLWICGFTAAVSNALLLTTIDSLYLKGPQDLTEHLFTYSLGDFVGIVVFVPLMLIARERLYDWRRGWWPMLGRGTVFLPVVVVISLALLPLPAATRYPLIFSSFVLYYVAFTWGWRAAAVAIALLSGGVHLVDDSLLRTWHPNQLQVLVATCGCAALLVGVVSDALHVQGVALASNVEMLSMRTQALREAANRLASQQEEERRRLGNELHDQLGQDMTAIATQVRLAERNAGDTLLRAELQGIGRLASSAHRHLRDIIYSLHPLVLDKFGLARALGAGPLAELARSHGIDYRCTIDEEAPRLPQPVAVGLYRICQEATSNGVKHGCGGRIHIAIALEHGTDSIALSLRIEDDAGEVDVPADKLGYGLQAIKDRANALGAAYRFNPASGHPRHWLYLNLAPHDLIDPAALAGGNHA